MKTFAKLLSAALLAAVAAPASAQDDDSWTGFYAGVQAGGGRERLSIATTDVVVQLTNIDPPGAQPLTVVPNTSVTLAGRSRDTSLLYGGVVGWQFRSGQAVFGLEGDLRAGRSSVDLAQTFALPNTALSPAAGTTVERSAKTRYEWSARARIGYAPRNTLFYATGGVAGAKVRARSNSVFTIPAGNAGTNGNIQAFPAQGPFTVSGSDSGSLIGWTAGIGLEQRLGSHIRIGIEGRYSDYGAKNFAFANATRTSTGTLAAAPFTARTDEGVYPGTTRIGLTDAQVNVRLVFAF